MESAITQQKKMKIKKVLIKPLHKKRNSFINFKDPMAMINRGHNLKVKQT